jgi:hypothetical protein
MADKAKLAAFLPKTHEKPEVRVAEALEYIARVLGLQTQMMMDEAASKKGASLSMQSGDVKMKR